MTTRLNLLLIYLFIYLYIVTDLIQKYNLNINREKSSKASTKIEKKMRIMHPAREVREQNRSEPNQKSEAESGYFKRLELYFSLSFSIRIIDRQIDLSTTHIQKNSLSVYKKQKQYIEIYTQKRKRKKEKERRAKNQLVEREKRQFIKTER